MMPYYIYKKSYVGSMQKDLEATKKKQIYQWDIVAIVGNKKNDHNARVDNE